MNAEISYLRDLAKQLKDIASHEKWDEKRALWEKKNALEKTRPLILCMLPNEAWEELVTLADCKSTDPFLKNIELYLLRQLYRAAHLRDDEVIEAVLYAPFVYRFSDWYAGRRRPYSGNRFKSEGFHPVILEYSDLKKLKKPELIEVDERTTEEQFALLCEVFGDILEVKLGVPTTSDTDSYAKGWGYSAVDVLCELRGLQNVFMDMATAPEFIHEAMEFITQGIADYKRTISENGWLRLNNTGHVMNANTPLGSNGLPFTRELPKDNVETVQYKDLWGYSMAQELSEVSPQMHAEFVLPYQKRLTDDFGLLSYGCCEPNDKKWDYIFDAFDNLREVSVSHNANLDIAAEKIQDKYVFSWKPNCSVIATFDEAKIREQLTEGFEKIKDCHIVCSLRDNLTLYGRPERAERWTDIAMNLAEEWG